MHQPISPLPPLISLLSMLATPAPLQATPADPVNPALPSAVRTTQEGGEESGQDPEPTPESLWLDLDFEKAKVRAHATEKFILFYWWAENSQTKRMDTLTWPDERVQSWVEENTVPVKLQYGHPDFDHLSSFWRVHRMPTTSLHAADGVFLGRIDGYQAPMDLLKQAQALLAGRGSAGKVQEPTGAAATDPMAWLGYGNALFEDRTKSTDAIAAYMWVIDHADESDPTILEDHLDFILRRLMYLSRIDDRGSTGIRQRVDAMRTQLKKGLASDSQALRTLSFIHWLGEGGTFADMHLWDELEGLGERQEEYRILMFPAIMSDLVAHRRYSVAAKYADGVLEALPTELERFQQERLRVLTAGSEATADERIAVDAERSRLSSLGADAFELLLGVGRGADAMDHGKRYLDVFPTGQECSALMKRALRLEHYTLVQKLAEMGTELVPDTDVKKVKIQRILARIPKDAEAGEKQDS